METRCIVILRKLGQSVEESVSVQRSWNIPISNFFWGKQMIDMYQVRLWNMLIIPAGVRRQRISLNHLFFRILNFFINHQLFLYFISITLLRTKNRSLSRGLHRKRWGYCWRTNSRWNFCFLESLCYKMYRIAGM